MELDQDQDEDDMDRADREPPKLGRRLRRQLSTIPSQAEDKKRRQSRAEPRLQEIGVQTSPRRRQGRVPHRKFKTRTQMERELGAEGTVAGGEGGGNAGHAQQHTGTRRRVAAEEEQDAKIRAEDDWRQWLPRRPVPEIGSSQRQEGDPHDMETQPYRASDPGMQPEQGKQPRGEQHGGPDKAEEQGYTIIDTNGTRRDPDSYERGWLREYTAAQEEEDRMGATCRSRGRSAGGASVAGVRNGAAEAWGGQPHGRDGQQQQLRGRSEAIGVDMWERVLCRINVLLALSYSSCGARLLETMHPHASQNSELWFHVLEGSRSRTQGTQSSRGGRSFPPPCHSSVLLLL